MQAKCVSVRWRRLVARDDLRNEVVRLVPLSKTNVATDVGLHVAYVQLERVAAELPRVAKAVARPHTMIVVSWPAIERIV